MKNRNKTYAKVMLAVAIGFSFAAEATNYALNQNKALTEKHTTTKAVQEKEGGNTSKYQGKLSFWE